MEPRFHDKAKLKERGDAPASEHSQFHERSARGQQEGPTSPQQPNFWRSETYQCDAVRTTRLRARNSGRAAGVAPQCVTNDA
eukprot:4675172-Pyramimonas_sp.AAC.2